MKIQFLSFFSVSVLYRSSTSARQKSIAPEKSNLKIFFAILKINQLSQLDYITTKVDWMKQGNLIVVVFFPLAMIKKAALFIFPLPNFKNYISKNDANLW